MPPLKKEILFGRNVRRLREALGLSIAELAFRAGMTPPAISQIETGKRDPQLRSVIQISEALGCRLTKLLEPL